MPSGNDRMVAEQIEARGVRDPRVLDAMRQVDRALFVPPSHLAEAYEDHPVAMCYHQTVSQPYVVAYMTELLQVMTTHRVLEIGAGSGYQAAVLSKLAHEVWSLEIIPRLAHEARERLLGIGARNVTVLLGTGWEGLPELAPFDRILAAAAAAEVPDALLAQLAPGGRMVLPVGPADGEQGLVVVTRGLDGEVRREVASKVRFVPMVREMGEWTPSRDG